MELVLEFQAAAVPVLWPIVPRALINGCTRVLLDATLQHKLRTFQIIFEQCQCKGLKTRQLTTQTYNKIRINRLNVWLLYVIIKCCWFILIVITLSLSAGGRTVQRNVSIHFIPHCQPGNRIPQTLAASIGHVDNLFSVDHKVPDVKTSDHCIFTIRLISFIRVCDSEDSTACGTRAKKMI